MVQELRVTVSQAITRMVHFHQVDMSIGRPLSSRIGDELLTLLVLQSAVRVAAILRVRVGGCGIGIEV